jgi:hypothetical protein
MLPAYCTDVEEYREWIKGPPALYDQREQPCYVTKRFAVEEVDADELEEWFDAIGADDPPKASSPSTPITHVQVSVRPLETRFALLASAWRDQTENLSSLTKIVSHPAYQAIIDLGKRGEPILPLILKDFSEKHGYWATALRSISGENPVDDRHIGDPVKVRADWLKWGKQRGFLRKEN